MKQKTSITLERDIINAIDRQVNEYGSRSEFLETAARRMLARLAKEEKDRRDLAIINRHAATLNREATDVLDFQVGL